MTRRRVDLTIGIVVGIALGIAVLVAFIFFGSEGSIDAPRISGVQTGKTTQSSHPAGAHPPGGGRTPSPGFESTTP